MSTVKSTRVSGTKEWAVANVNCVLGCSHQCRYCYARATAKRYGRIQDDGEWGTTYNRARPSEVNKRRKQENGTVMFPTTHDITPEFLGECLSVISNILASGNRLLIVSKPHIDCITKICDRFDSHRENILFRFSIGATSDELLSYWEPGAPTFSERVSCLRHAYDSGFETSVSAEPLIDSPRVSELCDSVLPYITDSLWIGKMNQIRSRVAPGTSESSIARIEQGQTDNAVREVFSQVGHHTKIKWKESYKSVLGMELHSIAGLDA